MLLENTGRFKDLMWFEKAKNLKAIIGGCGGIGSWLALLVSRAGIIPYLYDDDTIEAHNIGGQFFRIQDIGLLKTESVSKTLYDFSNGYCDYSSGKYREGSMSSYIMFSAFDNMQARKTMFENFSNFISSTDKNDPYYVKPIFIDGRLGAEYFEIYCVTEDKLEDYKKTLFNDSEVQDLPCTAKQTSHAAAMIAANMTGFLTNHLSNCVTNSDERVVPFKYFYSIPNCFTEVTI